MYKFSVLRLVNFRRNGVAELYCKNSEELESDGVIIVKTDFGDETIKGMMCARLLDDN